MRDFSDAPTPLVPVRPRGARMIEARSPKLGRLVQRYDHASFQQWVRLEADPDVEMFCECPTRLSRDPTSPLIHFSVQRRQSREFVLLSLGYHGVVHQFGSEPRCPVHKCWLETKCHSCGATSAYRINAGLIDAPFRCANCRRQSGHAAPSFVHRRPLPKPAF